MSSLLHRSRRLVACLAVVAPLLIAAPTASARNPCGQRVIENPFAQWNDVADYFLINQGDFAAGATAWDLGGGALVAENNPYSLHAQESASLSVSEGESATAPMVCVGVNDPTMRFFVRNTGSATGALKVEVTYRDLDYVTHTAELAVLTPADAGDAWTPSPTIDLAVPLVAQYDPDLTPVWFRFTAEGAGSSWLVDDVYVDPYGKG